jgi:diacylglycerol kinase family enzyme
MSADGPAKKRMLVIVNPYATTVSDRLKNLVVYALQGRYDVTAVDTEARAHAIEIGREAGSGEYDIVVAFGGDGTLNEVANGLAGATVPVSVLPGGSTNVVARTLGIPNDVVDATEHLLGLADDLRPRPIDLGVVNGRRFVFACGAGLDAAVVRRVDSHPKLKARAGEWYFTWSAVSAFYRRYLRDPVRIRLEVDGQEAEGITAIAQNSDPYTYFRDHPVRVCGGAALDNGTLSLAVLRRAAQRDMPTIAARVLVDRFPTPDHRQIEHFEGATAARVESISRDAEGKLRVFPLQVDGDYIGDHTELDLSIEPGALRIVA